MSRILRPGAFAALVATAVLITSVPALAQETVTVDLSTNGGPATQRATGFLHSVFDTEPATSLLAPIKPRLFRCSYLHCYSIYDRVHALGAEVQVIVGDLGNEIDWIIPYQDWTAWENSARTQVDMAKAKGYTPQYDIWNEPNIGEFWQGTQAQFFEAWRRGVIAIRESDPTATIVGPSITGFDQTYLHSFLLYAKANNVLPNVLSWHEWSGGSVIPSHAQTIRTWMSDNGINITRVSINELINSTEQTNPGITVRYLAGAERAVVDSAAHACWGDVNGENCWTPSLDGILTPNGLQARSVWWGYKGYADVTGTIVTVQPSTNIDGIAGRDLATASASSVFGRTGGSGSVLVRFTNVSSAPYLNGGSGVRVIAQRIPNSGSSALTTPTTLIDSTYSVVNDQISVTLSSIASGEAFTIRLESIVDLTPPSVASVSPAAGALNVALGTPVLVTFSEPMNAGTISTATLQLVESISGQTVAATVSYNAATRIATLTPAAALTEGTGFTLSVLGGEVDPIVKDTAGNTLATTFTSSFTTKIPQMVEAPSVLGLTQTSAQSTLQAVELVLGSVTSAPSLTAPIGRVIEQSPASGVYLPVETSVSVVLSTGVTVPGVVGQMLAAAGSSITDAGLVVGTVTNPFSNSVPAGAVISQSPSAGTQVNGGTSVGLSVSAGPYTTTTRVPTGTQILVGSLSGGSATSLASNDNVYYSVNATSVGGTRTTSWYGSFLTVPATLSNLRVNYRGSNSSSCTQTVAIWRWTDSSWVQLDSRSVSSSEVQINNLVPSGAPAAFVSGGGELRVRVQCTKSSSFTARGEVMSVVYDVPTGPPPPDLAPPVLSNGQPSGTLAIGTTQALLTLASNEVATCRYALTSGVEYVSMPTTFTTTGGTSHSTSVGGLTSGSQAFYVRCQDPAGNATTVDLTIGFTIAADTTAPVMSNGQPSGTLSASTTQALLSLTTNESATCRFSSTAGVAYDSMPSTFTTTGGTAHSSPITDLSSGSYTFYVRCKDGTGNASTNDYPIAFGIAVPDGTPPVLSNGQPSSVLAAGTAQTTLSVSTNEAATCRYANAAGTAYGSMTLTFTTTGGTAHSTSKAGLTNGGSYSAFVRCQDAAGNPTVNDYVISFSVALPPPPSTPGGPAPAHLATGVSTGATLTWSAAGATSYDLNFGTTNPPPLRTAGLTTATASPGPLAAGTTYFWQIVAKNSTGNTPGSVWSFTTAVTPPATTTLGLSTVASILDTGQANFLNGSIVTTTSSGTALSLSVYVGALDSSSTNRSYQVAIYTNSGGRPGTLVVKSASGTLVANSWNTLSVSATLQPNTSYWLLYNTNGRSSTVNNMKFNNGASGKGVYSTSAVTFGTWPATFPSSTLTTAIYSLFATVQP